MLTGISFRLKGFSTIYMVHFFSRVRKIVQYIHMCVCVFYKGKNCSILRRVRVLTFAYLEFRSSDFALFKADRTCEQM